MRGGKGSAVTTVLIVVLVLAVAGMGGYIFFSRNAALQAAEEAEKEKRSYVVTEDNADEVIERIEQKPKSVSSYTALMNSEWHFPDGESPSPDAYVANDPENKWPVWFEVTLNDGRSVYESPILPVDTHIRNFALTEDLEAGHYGATVTYHLVDDDQNELTTVDVGVSIIVEG